MRVEVCTEQPERRRPDEPEPRRRVALYAAGGAVALAAIAAVIWTRGDERQGAALEPVEHDANEILLTELGPAVRLARQRFSWTLRARGKLEPLEEVSIRAETWGVITRMWEDGAAVKKGDVVLELDKDDMERRIADHEAEILVREAELVQARQKQGKLVKSAEIAVSRAAYDLDWQRLNREILLLGASAEELARAEKELKVRELVERNRAEELAIFEELARQGFATTDEVGRNRLRLAEAKLEREKARIAQGRLLDGPRELEKKEAELQVKIAEYALESARKNVASAEAAARAAIAHAEKRLAGERHQLDRDRERLEKYTIRCPTDGHVLHVPHRRHGPWAPGRRVWRGVKVMSVPSIGIKGGRFKVTTKVGHSEVELIESDLPCRVAVAARRGESYEGKVIRVSSQGRDEYEDLDSFTKDKVAKSGRKTFDVEVEVLEEDAALRPGFRAEVEFLLGEVEDVLVVPWGAVGSVGAGGGRYVNVVKGSGTERRKVELGESDETSVVITSGCEEGDVVLLAYGAM